MKKKSLSGLRKKSAGRLFRGVSIGRRPTQGNENPHRRRPRESGDPRSVDSRFRGNDAQGVIFRREVATEGSRKSRPFRAGLLTPHRVTRVKGVFPQAEGWPRGRGTIVVISAPSGAGKSTLVRRLIASLPDLAFSVSHTTRPRREGEKEGRDYFFVTRRRFERMIAAGDFVEWAEVFGHLYGTSKAQLDKALAAGRDVLLDIDVQGHQQVKQRLPQALSVFVLPPSFRELKRRLTHRHSDSPQVVERRLAAARQEISHWPEYDYLVVNDRLSLATQALRAIIRAGRFRLQSQAERAQEICRTFGG